MDVDRKSRAFADPTSASQALGLTIDPVVWPLLTQPRFVQKSVEWLAARHNFITASVAGVFTPNGEKRFPWQDEESLFWEKVLPFVPRTFSNPHMQRGVDNEDVATALYEKLTGRKILDFGMLVHHQLWAARPSTVAPDEWMAAIAQRNTALVPPALLDAYGFFAGSPDGITTCGRLLEIKCPRVITEEVEPYYKAQCQINMEVANVEVCDLGKYEVSTGRFWMTTLARDRVWFAQWQQLASAFWQKVLAARQDGTQIPPEFSTASKKRREPDDDNTSASAKRMMMQSDVLRSAEQPFNE
jgi:hypothetical protein